MLHRIIMATLNAVALIAVGLTAHSAHADEPLVRLTYQVAGVQLRVTPQALAVPKSIPGSVLVEVVDGAGLDASAHAPGTYVEARLRGPGYGPHVVYGLPGEPLLLPPLNAVGSYSLDGIRLLDAETHAVRLELPQSVPIEVFPEVLVSTVTSTPLSLDEIQAKGIVIDDDAFEAVEFEIVFSLHGGSFPVTLPVVAPKFSQATEIIPLAEAKELLAEAEMINQALGFAVELPPELETAGLQLQVQGLLFQATDPDGDEVPDLLPPPIPAVMVIPGNIGFLRQFFSVQVYTANAAPQGSGLSVHSIEARITLPDGADPASPDDDPLQLAKVGDAAAQLAQVPILNPGVDGQAGTPDDEARLEAGQTGTGEFLVMGVKEGLHSIGVELTGVLDGLAAGEVVITGHAVGSVLVRNPTFSLVFSHPRVVRAQEPYTAAITITNTALATANLVSVSLEKSAISGGVLTSPSTVELGSIGPGESATATFDINPTQTGAIRFTHLAGSDKVNGRFVFSLGVDEAGVPLSPDAIGYPDLVYELPPELLAAADRLLGQALGTATAATLPPGVRRVTKGVIRQRVIELAEAGQRVRYGDDPAIALADLLLDWQSGRRQSAPFDDLLRVRQAGAAYRSAVATALAEAAGTAAPETSAADHLATLAAPFAGRHEAWSLAATSSPDLVAETTSALPGAIPYAGPSGHWTANRGSSAPLRWRADAPLDEATLTWVGLDGAGAGEHVRWRLSDLTLGTCLSFSPDGAGRDLIVDPGCDGAAAVSVAPEVSVTVQEEPPSVVAVVQDRTVHVARPDPSCGAPGYHNYGTVLGVLFSKPMAQELVAAPTAYELDGTGVRAGSVQIQPGGRLALLHMRKGVGDIIPRSLAISGLQDSAGQVMAPVVREIDLTITDSDGVPMAARDGVAVTGSVIGVDGRPVAGVPVTLTMHDLKATPAGCLPLDVRVSQTLTDAQGHFDFDFVLAGMGYSVSATNTSGLSDAALALLLESTSEGEVSAAELLALAQQTGAEQALLEAFATGSLGQAVVLAAGLDRAVLRDFVPWGSQTRIGTTVPVVLRFRGRGTVTGQVLGEDGVTPFAGAAVNLFPDPDSRELGRGVFSDADGRFTFLGVPLGVYTVAVDTSAGHHRIIADYLAQPGATNTHVITLTAPGVQTFGTLEGQVVEADGHTPHPGATVLVGTDTFGFVAMVTADAGGMWRAESVPSGTWSVTAVSLDAKRKGRRDNILVGDGTTSFVAVLLQQRATVHGRVLMASGLPACGALIAGGEALVQVERSTDPSDPYACSGAFTLHGVPTGARNIQAGLQPEDSPFGDGLARLGAASLVVEPGDANAVDVILGSRGTLTGVLRDVDGTALSGVNVAIPGSAGFFFARTDADGVYRFEGLTTGGYTVSAPAPPVDPSVEALLDELAAAEDVQDIAAVIEEAFALYNGTHPGEGAPASLGIRWNYTSATIQGDGWVEHADLRLRSTGTISGRTVNGQGTPIGATVRLSGLGPNKRGGPDMIIRGEIDSDPADGTFSFPEAALWGDVAVEAVSPFYPAKPAAENTTSEGSEDWTGVELVFPLAAETKGRLIGCVYDVGGALVADQDVPVSISWYPGYGVTAVGGCFDTQISLPAGQYVVEAVHPVSGAVGKTIATIAAGQLNSTSVQLLGRGDIMVSVFDGAGVPVDDRAVEVTATQLSYPNEGPLELATTDGTLVIPNVGEGVWSVTACELVTINNCGTASVTVAPGLASPVGISLGATGTIEGNFYTPNGSTPVGSAQITVGNIGFATTDAAGFYRVVGVPLGTWTIVGKDDVTGRYAKAQATLTSDGQTVVADLIGSTLGTVEGTVTDTDGTSPAVGVSVSLDVNDGFSSQRTVTTDQDGRYRFPGTPPGVLTLLARDTDSPQTGHGTGVMPTDTTTVVVDIALEPLGDLQVRVLAPELGPGGEAVVAPEAVVYLGSLEVGCQEGSATECDAVRFPDLDLGAYTVTARVLGTGSVGRAVAQVSVAGGTSDVDVTLRGAGSVVGVVRDAQGVDVGPGVTVWLTVDEAGPAFGTTDSVATDADGGFSFEDVPVGSFRVTAIVPPLAGGASGVIASSGDEVPVDIELGDTGTVGGVVLSAAGALVAGAEVLVTFKPQSPTEGLWRAVTDGDGRFQLAGVPVGAVSLLALAPVGDGRRSASAVLEADAILDLTLHLDEAPPQILAVDPPAGEVDVPTAKDVELTFSEALDPATVTATGVRLLDPGGVEVPVVVSVVGDGDRVLLDHAGLASDTTYTVVVHADDGPQDLVGRPLITTHFSTFTTRDDIPPQNLSFEPANGSVQVTRDSPVRLTFDEAISAAAVSVTWLAGGQSVSIDTLVDVGTDPRVLAITPTAGLPDTTTLTVSVAGIRDLAGNEANGGAPFVSTFTTVDLQGPQIADLLITGAVTGCALANATTVCVPEGGALAVTAVLAEAEAGARMTLKLKETGVQLGETSPGVLTVALDAPAATATLVVSAIDLHHNHGPPFELTLLVQPNEPPVTTLERVSPASGPVPSGSTLEVRVLATDDAGLDDLTGAFSGALEHTASNSGASGQLLLSGLVPADTGPGAVVTVTGSATDTSGAVGAVSDPLEIPVSDGVAPAGSWLVPADGAELQPGEPATLQLQLSDAFGVSSVSWTSAGAVTGGGDLTLEPAELATTLLLDLPVPLDALPRGAVTLTATVTDEAGNQTEVVRNTSVADVVGPVVEAVSPPAGAVDVGVATSVTVSFDEALAPASLTLAAAHLEHAGTGAVVSSAPSVSADGRIVTLPLGALLEHSTTYRVVVSSAVTDVAGNPLQVPLDSTFTTIAPDVVGPRLLELLPADQATDTSPFPTVRASFDEGLDPGGLANGSLRVETAGGAEIPGEVALAADALAVTWTPDAALTMGATYRVVLDAGWTDAAGNAITDGAGGTLTTVTADFTVGTVAISAPADGTERIETQPLAVTVEDSTGAVSSVTAAVAGVSLGQDPSAPFSWDGVTPALADVLAAGGVATVTATAHFGSGSVPLEPVAVTVLGAEGDRDGDGMPNGVELTNGTDPFVDDAAADPDLDGLSNLQEVAAGTDPLDSDSDDDLVPDGIDVAPTVPNLASPSYDSLAQTTFEVVVGGTLRVSLRATDDDGDLAQLRVEALVGGTPPAGVGLAPIGLPPVGDLLAVTPVAAEGLGELVLTGVDTELGVHDLRLVATDLGGRTGELLVTYVVGAAPDCDDDNPCTIDVLDPVDGCVNTPYTGSAKRWGGGVVGAPTDWATAGNWCPAGVPGPSDDVVVPTSMAHELGLTADAGVASLTVEPGASLGLNGFDLTVSGDLDALGVISGAGTVVLSGALRSVRGNVPDLAVQGTPVLNGDLFVSGDLAITAAPSELDVNGWGVTVEGDLVSYGYLRMNEPTDDVLVLGGAHFGESWYNDSTGRLTAGLLRVHGDFSQSHANEQGGTGGTSGRTFVAQGGHTVRLEGTSPQAVSFTTPNASRFAHLEIVNPAGVTFVTHMEAVGVSSVAGGATATFESGAVSAGTSLSPDAVMTLVGTLDTNDLTVSAGATLALGGLRLGGPIDVQGTFSPPAVISVNGPTILPAHLAYQSLVLESGVCSLAGATTLSGSLTVTSSAAELNVGAGSLDVAGDAALYGYVRMNDAAGELLVRGDVHFGNSWYNDSSGRLTAGVLRVWGDFSQAHTDAQGGSANGVGTFVAAGAHTVRMEGMIPQQVSFTTPTTSHFYHLQLANPAGVTFTTNVEVWGNLTVEAGVPAVFDGDAEVEDMNLAPGADVTVAGTLDADGLTTAVGSVLAVGALVIQGAVDLQGTFTPPPVVTLSQNTDLPAHLTYVDLVLTAGAVNLTGDTTVSGDVLITSSSASLNVGPHLLTVDGGLTSYGYVRMNDPAGEVLVGGNTHFGNSWYNDSAGYLTAGLMRLRGDFSQSSADAGATNTNGPGTFVASGSHTVRFEGVVPQLASFTSPTTSHFQDLEIANAQGVTFTTHVEAAGLATLEESALATFDVSAKLEALEVLAGATAFVTGELDADLLTTAAGSELAVGSLRLGGPITIDGTFEAPALVTTNASTTLPAHLTYTELVVAAGTTGFSGDATVTGDVLVANNQAELAVAAHSLTIGGDFTSYGYLRMNNAAGDMVVSGAAHFGNTWYNDSSGRLTAGVLRVLGAFSQSHLTSTGSNGFTTRMFAPSGSHTVRLEGSAPQTVSFTTPSGSGFANLVVANPAGVTWQTTVAVTGSLSVLAGSAVTAEGDAQVASLDVEATGTLDVAGELNTSGLATAVGSTLSVGSLRLGGPMSVQGAFTPPAVVTTVASTALQSEFVYTDLVVAGGELDLLGDTTLLGDLKILTNTAIVDVSGFTLSVGGDVESYGYMRMTNAASEVVVAGDAHFGNTWYNSSTNYLTAGLLRLSGNFTQSHLTAAGSDGHEVGVFAPSGSQRVRLEGSSPQSVSFTTPASSHFRFLEIAAGADVTFETSVVVTADLELVASVSVAAATTTTVLGTLRMLAGSVLDILGAASAVSCDIDPTATITGGAPCP